jgi:hypothetical protein
MAVDINADFDAYLDATAGLHNKVGAAEFGKYVELLGQQVEGKRFTKGELALIMGVSRQTLYDYLRRYNEQHASKDHERQAF